MASTRECHRISLFKGPNVPEGPGVEDVVEVGRYLLDSDKKYVNKWWSDDEMRTIPLPTEEELRENPINLNEGFDSTKWDEKTVNGNILETDLKMYHALFDWIYIKAYDLTANNIRIVANGPTLYDLLQAPYGWKNRDGHATSVFTIYLSKYNGILYMFRFYEPQSEADAGFRLVKYRGKKFRSSMTKFRSSMTKFPSSMTKSLLEGDCEENNNEDAEFKRRVVNKAAFRGLNLLYTTKVSAIDSKGRFVSLHVMPEDNLGKMSYYRKLLRQWSVALFTPAPKILIGLRQRHENENDADSEVLVTRLRKISTATIPDLVKENTPQGKRIIWEPRFCYRNLECVIDMLMAVTEDDPKVVYCLASEPNQHGYVDHLTLRKMAPELGIEVIPTWYIE